MLFTVMVVIIFLVLYSLIAFMSNPAARRVKHAASFSILDPVAGNCSRRITSKRLAGNLLSIALGISLGILFLSLLLDPAQSDAYPAEDLTPARCL